MIQKYLRDVPAASSVNRRTFLVGLAPAAVLSGCMWPEFFDLSWDEEVLLHDGALIVVHLTYTYQRLERFARYSRSILRKTGISFDAGPPIGRFSQVFERHRVDMVDRVGGNWFLVLERRGGRLAVKTAAGWDELWGPVENGAGQKCWRLSPSGLSQASIKDLPGELLKKNLLIDYADAEVLAEFDGHRVTLGQKNVYSAKYQMNPDDQIIRRPAASIN